MIGEVTISLERYNELVAIEQRAEVIVERFWHGKYLTPEDILWILGTELSETIALEVQKKRGDKDAVFEQKNIIAEVKHSWMPE